MATDAGGHRCILDSTHGNDSHAYAGADFHLGSLMEAVAAYLEERPGATREFLARILAEIKAEVGR